MKPLSSLFHNDSLRSSENFSLVLGGPLFQLLRRAHLSDDSLLLIRQRILVVSLFAWLPLLILSALERHLTGGTSTLPFLLDLDAHVRFLVAIPLLISAELVAHRRLGPVVRQFLDRQIIPDRAMAQFDAAIAAAFRLRNSVLAEVLLLAFVYVVGILIVWRRYIALDTATWYATPSAEGTNLSFAGMWYGYVSLPILQFLICRWYFRMAIWARFLWQVSRIKLRLVPMHPDRNAGLGFLSHSIYAFGFLTAAHGALLAGQLANRILYLGAKLTEFTMEIASLVIFLVCIVFGPLLVFVPQLGRAKRIGNREYGTLAERYVREFDTKWLRGGALADEPFVASDDIQSLADLGTSLEVVRTMRIAPITMDAILCFVATILVPIAPLALAMMPLEELLEELVKMLLRMVF
jgi:hypothetical protein